MASPTLKVFERVVGVSDAGVAIMMVEQNARRCLEVCDYAYVLDQGRCAREGPGAELLADPSIADLYLGGLNA